MTPGVWAEQLCGWQCHLVRRGRLVEEQFDELCFSHIKSEIPVGHWVQVSPGLDV